MGNTLGEFANNLFQSPDRSPDRPRSRPIARPIARSPDRPQLINVNI
ncbi:hypothetical protein NDI47_14540 [Microcoleus vaginatus GB1-A2]|nr:hypothetical protein [Microcoleus sp. FACHB-61]